MNQKKSSKNNKKNSSSQKNQKLPPNVKIFEISPRKIFLYLLIVVMIWALYRTASIFSDVQKVVNTKIGLQNMVKNYDQKQYSEIKYYRDGAVEAIRPEKTVEQNGKILKQQEIDKIVLPVNMTPEKVGLYDKENPTKFTTPEEGLWALVKDVFIGIFPVILMLFLFIFLVGRAGGGPMGGAMSFIRSRAREYDPEGKDKVTFKDVAGSEEEKSDLEEVVDFLKNPEKYQKLGAKIPRGILLQGPPGTGKTLLARAVAGEASVPFFSISGSEFVEMFVGVGASRVRDLFAEAREKAPSIIFIDEIDAIGKKRSPGMGGGHDEREQTLNQILTEMDGFDNETNVIVMAATNRADVLDKALLRPGRFDRKVTIDLPALEDRKKILEVHKKNKPFEKTINWDRVAGITAGFSGAEIGNLLNEAAILAGKNDSEVITTEMVQKSVEKVVMGNERKSHKMTEHEKWLTSVHEVGHAIVGKMLPHTDAVHKISILPRGGAGGVTWFLPDRDTTYVSKAKYLDKLAMIFAGRAAEEIFLGEEYITTGASSDIERATTIARAMIMRFGFDPDLGLENYASDSSEGNYLGGGGQEKTISEASRKMIDTKVRELLAAAYQKAKTIILENKELHEKIARDLLEKEEMTREEFDEYFEGNPKVPEKVGK